MSDLSQKSIDMVKATTPAVAPKAGDITSTFYKTMFERNPEVLAFFNKANQSKGAQSVALADAVCQYALNIDNLGALGPLVKKISHRHVALSILPEHYPVVHANMMVAIGKELGEAVTPEVAAAWDEAVLFLAKVFIDAEEQLYQQMEKRVGGWRGEKEFVVTKKEEVADGTIAFNFKREDYDGPFEYTAGQYLTIRLPGLSPRHYTLTSAPNSKELQCTVRKVNGGEASTYMHEQLKVGDKVLLGVPAGVFTVEDAQKPKVLLSAGIGVTPSLAFLQAFGTNVKKVFHIDQCEERHAYKREFEETGVPCVFHYTKNGRPDLQSELASIVAEVGRDTEFYVCGPNAFMSDVLSVLEGLDCKFVYAEVFGTGIVQKCPFSGKEGKCPVSGH